MHSNLQERAKNIIGIEGGSLGGFPFHGNADDLEASKAPESAYIIKAFKNAQNENSEERTERFKENIGILKELLPQVRAKQTKTSTYKERLQEWEGYVVSINHEEQTFRALLCDITKDKDFPDEEADFSFEQVADLDKPLFSEGAVFWWTIAYRHKTSGKAMESELVFRRMPKWTKGNHDRAKERANFLMSTLVWE